MSMQCNEYRSYQQNKSEAKCQQYIMGIHGAFFFPNSRLFWSLLAVQEMENTGAWFNIWYWLLVDPPWTQNCFSGQFCGSHFARLNNARIVLNHQPDCFSSFGFSWTKTLLIISSRSSSSYPMPSVRLDFVCWVLTHFWEKHKPVYHLLALLAHSSSAALAKKLDHLTPGRSRLRVQNL